MRIPARIRYAVRILVEIAKEPEQALALSEVEKRQMISAKFAKQILQPLMRAGLVQGVRGLKGGYRLLRSPAEINLLEITRALSSREDRVAPCLLPEDDCPRRGHCGVERKWLELQQTIDEFLGRTSLQDVIDGDS